MSSSSRPTTSSSRPTIWNACVSIALVSSIGLTLLLNFTAGGLQIKGNHGASLDRCTFKKTDTPYEYPNQPLAMDEPPYSTLFESVCIDGGTERPIRGLTSVTNGSETYICACCGNPLFGGEAKFDSATGWPSFWAPYGEDAIGYARDMVNVELHCAHCGAHLGHVFTWPRGVANPTGLRYCIDGVCLRKVVDAVLAAAGGAYIEKMPVMLPELVVMITVVALVVSCSINVVSAYELGARFLCATRERDLGIAGKRRTSAVAGRSSSRAVP